MWLSLRNFRNIHPDTMRSISDLIAWQYSIVQKFQHSKQSNIPNNPTFQTIQQSNIPTFQHSNIPTFQHSNIPTFQHEILQYFYMPTLQHFNFSTSSVTKWITSWTTVCLPLQIAVSLIYLYVDIKYTDQEYFLDWVINLKKRH